MRNMTVVIEQISERTNMLAINAGIQSAHAGDSQGLFGRSTRD
jgi:methyl-accepting chemotaxis protein